MSKPQGSAYEAANQPRASRKLSRRIRKWISWRVVGLVAWLFPYLYMAYCWLVWKTSTVEDGLTGPLLRGIKNHDRFVALLWHQEVFTVAYAYKHLYGHTVASTGNFGRIITGMLERCNFTVFRGGSSRGTSRRKRIVVDMIRHMRTEPRVPYGITVDGSHGPPWVMKKGGVVIARACNSPIFATRTWYSRYIQLNTWDKTTIPLPFGRIRIYAVGPYWVDPNGGDEELNDAIRHIDDELLNLTSRAFEHIERKPYGYAPQGYPEGWKPRWQPGVLGLKRTRWDLEPDDPPPWAHRPPSPD